MGNYCPKAALVVQFCVAEGTSWLLAIEATWHLYIAHLMSKRTIKAASLQPYQSAVNTYRADRGNGGPAKVRWAFQGTSSLRVQGAAEQDGEDTGKAWLSSKRVAAVLDLHPTGRVALAAGAVDGDCEWARGRLIAAQAKDWVQLPLGKLGGVPQEGGHFSGNGTCGACTYPRAVGALLEKCCFVGGFVSAVLADALRQ
ncbi:hypothetical protein CYMTET_53893 [Cymbomonas tetramitiformis]|uniref:Uncharacterized protein n=1 Tax=Cymbomonas tetramitiformis TaxID=36881 RepID=A0AAE0EQ49_9CHLO|nr:hypothetical protein CYMTET_53893 [Cymbomonas tetramitiformis]